MVEERIAVLETKVEELHNSQAKIMDKLDGISGQLLKQKGFIGGIMFVFSALVTAATIAVQYFRSTH